MQSVVVFDAAGRRRSPATLPAFHAGCPPRNKGLRDSADPTAGFSQQPPWEAGVTPRADVGLWSARLLVSDCTAEPIGSQSSASNHEASLLVTQTLFGWVTASDALLDALGVPT